MGEFSWPIRVYYEDTDAGGVVYHSQYLNFMERARTEWLRTMGLEQNILRDNHKVLFVVHSLKIDYKKAAKFNDELLVTSTLIKAAGASMSFEQNIYREQELLSSAFVRIACLEPSTFSPKKIPEFILMEMDSDD